MKKYPLSAIVYIFCAVLLLLSCTLSFFAPFPRKATHSKKERYRCTWENGEKTTEDYHSAFSALAGYENGSILLRRDGVTGHIPAERAEPFETVLREGELGALLALDCLPLDPLERAALGHGYAQTLYYSDGEYFGFTGTTVQPTDRRNVSTLVLLSGKPKATEIAATGARKLVLHGECAFSGKALLKTFVTAFAAFAPYCAENGVLYFNTASGRRLVAATSCVSLTIEGNVFADEGALLPCAHLKELTLPFCGSDLSGTGEEYRGEFAHLFAQNRVYRVPATLKRITVTGGKLVSHAFYACEKVEEIVCCGLDPQAIDKNAFVDCPSLTSLHVPRASLNLPFEDYNKSELACGCTLYERRSA